MKQETYYVATAACGEIFQPTIVERFECKADASSYAALMCRVKHRKYIVIEQIEEWDGTKQSSNAGE